MPPLTACIEGIGVLGPGFDDWNVAAAVLRGEQAYRSARTALPVALALPSAERRRAGRVIRLALAVCDQALARSGTDVRALASVFSSSGADGDNCHEICRALATQERHISPTRFHNSVHNAAAGYWGIASGCTAPSTSLCAYDASFGAALLEAFAQLAAGADAVLVCVYDADYPLPLQAHRGIPDAFAVALLLRAAPAAPAPLARLALQLAEGAPERMHDSALEALRVGNPAARCLPLLQRLARREAGALIVDYLPPLQLRLEVAL
jgi:hypothetical protein